MAHPDTHRRYSPEITIEPPLLSFPSRNHIARGTQVTCPADAENEILAAGVSESVVEGNGRHYGRQGKAGQARDGQTETPGRQDVRLMSTT